MWQAWHWHYDWNGFQSTWLTHKSVRKWYSHWDIYPMAWGSAWEQLLPWYLCCEADLSPKLDAIITPDALYVNSALHWYLCCEADLSPKLDAIITPDALYVNSALPWYLCCEADLSQKLDAIITPGALYVNSALHPQLWPLCPDSRWCWVEHKPRPALFRAKPSAAHVCPRRARCKCSLLHPSPFWRGIVH